MAQYTQLSDRILAILQNAATPLLAKEVAAALRKHSGVSVNTTDVNRELYGALKYKAACNSEFQWQLRDARGTSGTHHKRPALQKAEDAAPPATPPRPPNGTLLECKDANGDRKPSCPVCGGLMVVRTAKRGRNRGGQFYGCASYPKCTGALPFHENGPSGMGPSGEPESTPKNAAGTRAEAASAGTPPPYGLTSGALPAAADRDDIPACPECGAPMTIKTARHGTNAGGQFYGCSRYPSCKGILSLDHNGDSTIEPSTIRAESQKTSQAVFGDLPRRVTIAASSSQYQIILFEGVAVPRAAIPAIVQGSPAASILRALTQWGLEIPARREGTVSTFSTTWLTIAEKLLKRGGVVPLAPKLESALSEVLSPTRVHTTNEWLEALRAAALRERQAISVVTGFDSPEEEIFYNRILPGFDEHDLRSWISRQVSIDSLVDDDKETFPGQRIDFLFAFPEIAPIVIEVDGTQHAEQRCLDEKRDAALGRAGFQVHRIAAEEIRKGEGEGLTRLRERLRIPSHVTPCTHKSALDAILLAKRAHQLQLSLLQAVALGLTPSGKHGACSVSVSVRNAMNDLHREEFLKTVLQDLNDLIRDLAEIYLEKNSVITFVPASGSNADVDVVFPEANSTATPFALVVRDLYLPVSLSSEISCSCAVSAAAPKQPTLERILERVFGFTAFREGQYEAMERCLQDQDAILLLPTGAGKSVCYQLAALLRPGLCMVVDPILSLIEDQIENLRYAGVDRSAQVTSAVEGPTRQRILDLLSRGEYQFCFVAPERFQDQSFRESLRILTAHSPLSLIAVDEAHCVSEWGHDFRPAYLNIARTSREYGARAGRAPPLMAMTGTASRAVLKDIQRELEITDFEAIITPSTFDRPELRFAVISCSSSEKMLRLRGLLEGLPRQFGQTTATFFQPAGGNTMSGLVFCPWVNGDYGVVEIAQGLSRQLGQQIPFYAGSPPTGYDERAWHHRKRRVASDFKRNVFSLLTCTKAFGMGIDKPNIRYTLHYSLPPSVESFYQEAGRAGRDRQLATSVIIYSNDDPGRTRLLLNPVTSIEKVHEVLTRITKEENDDITRSLFFHRNSFLGVDAEYAQMLDVIGTLGDLDARNTVTIPFKWRSEEEDDKRAKERAIHRLLTIGVISDYTVDYRARRFTVYISGITKQEISECLYRYIAAYQRGQAEAVTARVRESLSLPYTEFVKATGRELIQFVYEVIERSRRRALSEMLDTCSLAKNPSDIRDRVLRYLGTSVFSEAIEQLLDAPNAGLGLVPGLLAEVRSAIDAGHLRGETGRALQSYPDHAGLLLMRAMSEAMTQAPQAETVRQNVEACTRFAREKYGVPEEMVSKVVIDAARMLTGSRLPLCRTTVSGLLAGASRRRDVARLVLARLPLSVCDEAMARLITEMNSVVKIVVKG